VGIKKLFEVLLEIYMGSQIHMLNSLQFNMNERKPSTPPSLCSLPKWRRSSRRLMFLLAVKMMMMLNLSLCPAGRGRNLLTQKLCHRSS
jgi:hypothetical protein